ncbi:hypothetical protein Patl1_02973 [Pistacia atlantica]|uniref:Uncharacterized protein n=1 Tax=Pistacia atlantica TaxID=434234 RepID=A0ACC1C4K6_9ROSI|nr:hypothetical protein Patl1_02973 [Pistacia atlantica]
MDPKSLRIDTRSGFNSITKTFHSLRPPIDLPLEDTPLSAAEYAFSLLATSPWPHDSVALINSVTAQRISYSEFTRRTNCLAAYLQKVTQLSINDTAFILSPNSIQLPILYFSLLSLGVVISPANPLSTQSEISRQVQLSKPVIAFATASTIHKLPKLKHQTILIDSSEFESIMMSSKHEFDHVKVKQSDLAAIMYSSGTTGNVKGVMLTQRNLMAQIANSYASRQERESPTVTLYTMPYFHMVGFIFSLRSVALSETVVVMERFDLKKMLKAVEEFRVTRLVFPPPVIVALSKDGLTDSYDLSSVEIVVSGAAPLGKDTIAAFTARFPKIVLGQGYGLTETAGAIFLTKGPEEAKLWGSTGRLSGSFEGKIVDPETGEALPPCKEGELWVKGPSVMKGYVGEEESTSATLFSDGWLRTGDICYINEDGFLFVVDRLKELIKYRGYQVAPAELEQLLISHPQIVDAAVTGYPDKEAGQVPMAFVVRQPQSTLNEAEIMDFVAKQVAPYKKIRRVAFINSITKSAAGKILRKELRKVAVPPGTSSRL